MEVRDIWRVPRPSERAARAHFFTLMEWSRATGYAPSQLEWLLIQQVFDEMHFRHADTLALVGFCLGVPLSFLVSPAAAAGGDAGRTGTSSGVGSSGGGGSSSWGATPTRQGRWRRASGGGGTAGLRRWFFPLLFATFGHEAGLRTALAHPAEEFWHAIVHVDSDLGAAARRIHVPREGATRAELHSPHSGRFIHASEMVERRRGLPEALRAADEFLARMTINATLHALFAGTAAMVRRSAGNGSASSPPPSSHGAAPTGLRGGGGDSGSVITDVFKLTVNTRFFTWRPLHWMHVATPTTTVNSVTFGLPQLTAATSDVVAWTLRSQGLIETHASYGAKLWWKAHLAAFRVLGAVERVGSGAKRPS